jgi:putative ABC transport system permease protein
MRRIALVREVRLGVKNLGRHRLRSLLTMLGVVFGVGSVVAMLAVGEGASQEALEQIRRLGSNNILIRSVKPVDEPGAARSRTFMSVYGLLYDDELRIAETFSSVRRTVPAKTLRKEGRLGARSLELRIVGTTPDWFDLVRRPVIAGRVLLPQDMDGRHNAAVLTEYGARRLLALEGGIGQAIRIGGEYFEVVGIVRNQAGDAGTIQTPDQEVDVYIPINVAQERFGDIMVRRLAGSRTRELVELHEIIVQVASIEDVEPTAAGIEAMLVRFHKRLDYRVSVPLALLRQAEATKRTFNIVLGSIAGISLLVGGIGIMNIMLASVTERTREIGIRRAIGAKRRQIVRQFLIETVVLSTTGGFTGVALGLFIPWLITHFAGLPTVVKAPSIVLSLGISMAVGIVFGLYPAVRAARLDPIVALRH